MRLRQGFVLLVCLAAGLPSIAMAEQYVGLVYPVREASLSMGTGGIVSRIHVKPGQQVKANEVLLTLDDRMQLIEANRRKIVFEDRAELKVTEERVRALSIMYRDTKKVYESTGSISRDEMAKLEVEYASARGRLEQLQAQKQRERFEYEGALRELQMRRLTAPVAGVITRIEPKIGEWAKPGDMLMELVDASVCYLKANVPLAAVSKLRVGSMLPIRIEDGSNVLAVKAKVSFISAVADPASGLVEMRLTFANPGQRIKPGIKGIIDISPESAQ